MICCFCKLGVLFVDVLTIRALLQWNSDFGNSQIDLRIPHGSKFQREGDARNHAF